MHRIEGMGAPQCFVVLREPLAEGQVGLVGSWLNGLGRVAPDGHTLGLVIEGSAAALGLDPEKEGEPRVSLRLGTV